MLNQLLTTFQNFFSRSFWFGSFLPVAITAAIHIVILELVFPDTLQLATQFDAALSEQTISLALAITGLVVAAYVFAPFTTLLRGILDGRALPNWLHDWLRESRFSEWRRLEDKMAIAKRNRVFFFQMYDQNLKAIYRAKEDMNSASAGPNKIQVEQAVEALNVLTESTRSTELPDRVRVQATFDKILSAYNSRAANFSIDDLSMLEDACSQFIAMLYEAVSESEYRLRRTPSNYKRTDLLPTRVADTRKSIERYCEELYHVDFSYVWARIQMILPAESNQFSLRLRDAQSQVNFSILILGLMCTVPLVWLPILFAVSKSPWLFLAVGFLSVPVLLFLYELVVQSEAVFGELVRAAIDKYRLQVLTEIVHQPLPQTLAVERTLWLGLRSAAEAGNSVDFLLSKKDN